MDEGAFAVVDGAADDVDEVVAGGDCVGGIPYDGHHGLTVGLGNVRPVELQISDGEGMELLPEGVELFAEAVDGILEADLAGGEVEDLGGAGDAVLLESGKGDGDALGDLLHAALAHNAADHGGEAAFGTFAAGAGEGAVFGEAEEVPVVAENVDAVGIDKVAVVIGQDGVGRAEGGGILGGQGFR